MPYNQDPTTKQVEMLIKLIAEGYSAYGIRKSMKISQTQVTRWLTAAQLKPKAPKRNVALPELNARERAEFIDWWKTMPSQHSTLAKYGIGVKTLRNWLEQMNLAAIPAQARPQKTRKPMDDHSWRAQRQLEAAKKEEPRISIADRFRAQGQATANPYR